jgi:hypothetical protein
MMHWTEDDNTEDEIVMSFIASKKLKILTECHPEWFLLQISAYTRTGAHAVWKIISRRSGTSINENTEAVLQVLSLCGSHNEDILVLPELEEVVSKLK